jgi:hypothetical protein
MYSSTLSLALTLDGVAGGQHHARAASRQGKVNWYSLYGRLGGLQDWFGRVRKISSPTGSRSLDRPARSESLYLLRYSGRRFMLVKIKKCRITREVGSIQTAGGNCPRVRGRTRVLVDLWVSQLNEKVCR